VGAVWRKRSSELRDVGEPGQRVLLQTTCDGRFEAAIEAQRVASQRFGGPASQCDAELGKGTRRKRRRAREQFVDNRAQCPDVGLGVRLVRGPKLLRRNAVKRSQKAVRLRQTNGRETPQRIPNRGKTKLGNLDACRAIEALGQEKAGRLQMAMDAPLSMSFGDRLRSLQHPVDRRGHGQSAPNVDERVEVVTVRIFDDRIGLSAGERTRVENAHGVLVLEA